jgi:hypothetical protein
MDLRIVDLFSNFTLLSRHKTRDALTAATALLDWFSLFGAPRMIVSDHGLQFVNNSDHVFKVTALVENLLIS